MNINISFVVLIFIVLSVKHGYSKHLETKIIGGEFAREGQFLYPVSLRKLNKHICGGALIRNDTVLTAAHCVEDTNLSLYTVAVGILEITQAKPNDILKVRKILSHEKYDKNSFQHDIAVLKIETVDGLAPTHKGRTIKLNEDKVKDHTNCTVMGWGVVRTATPPIASPFLKYVFVPINSRVTCDMIYSKTFTEDMLCAGTPGKDSCQGDSGGPLICNDKLAGIVSFGKGCAVYPGIYTDVSHYISWIKKAQNSANANNQSLYLIIYTLATSMLLFRS